MKTFDAKGIFDFKLTMVRYEYILATQLPLSLP